MEGKTASGFSLQIQEETQGANQEKLVGSDGLENPETE